MNERRWAQNIMVLLTHRERLVACNTFEEFKAQQIKLIDYMIEDFEGLQKTEDAANKFMADQ